MTSESLPSPAGRRAAPRPATGGKAVLQPHSLLLCVCLHHIPTLLRVQPSFELGTVSLEDKQPAVAVVALLLITHALVVLLPAIHGELSPAPPDPSRSRFRRRGARARCGCRLRPPLTGAGCVINQGRARDGLWSAIMVHALKICLWVSVVVVGTTRCCSDRGPVTTPPISTTKHSRGSVSSMVLKYADAQWTPRRKVERRTPFRGSSPLRE